MVLDVSSLLALTSLSRQSRVEPVELCTRRYEIGPIYKHFRGQFADAWRQLCQTEQADLGAKVNEALEQVGGERMILCNARWHSDQWMYIGVEVFPDMEAVQHHVELLNEFDWFHYVQGESTLGTEWEPE